MSEEYELNVPWLAIQNRIALVGVGAELTASATTPVTIAYTRLLGTFENEFIEGFFIDTENDNKLTYHPDDGVTRTFKLQWSGQVEAPTNNDKITIGIEYGNGTTEIVAERTILCRVADSPYNISALYVITLNDMDTIEIQIKGDSSFTATVDAFSTVLSKMV